MAKSVEEIVEEFKNRQAGRRAMEELDLLVGILDGLEGSDFSDTRSHLDRSKLLNYMSYCYYDINKMTDRRNRNLFSGVYSHLNSCPRCYEKVEEACVIIEALNEYNRTQELIRN